MKIFAVLLLAVLCALSVSAREELPPARDADFQEEPARLEESLERPSSRDDLERTVPRSAPAIPSPESLARISITLTGRELMQGSTPKFEYYTPLTNTTGCCPRKWNYGCRSSSYRMPCFYESSIRSWCCPIAPQIYARRCLCKQCAVLTSTCVQPGYCARRYTKRWFTAVCFRQGAWAFLRQFVKSVPSSCYCRTRSFLPFATLDVKGTSNIGPSRG